MSMGLRGAFIISWAQTRIEGDSDYNKKDLAEGMSWSWHGRAFPLEGKDAALVLTSSRDLLQLRAKAARVVHKFMQRPAPLPHLSSDLDDPLYRDAMVLSDGVRFFSAVPLTLEDSRETVLLFPDGMPPSRQHLTIISLGGGFSARFRRQGPVVCFVKGTRLAALKGEIAVEDVRAGDYLVTRDNGLKEVLWVGQRSLSGAQLFAKPHLRPIRLPQGLFGKGKPEPDLLVSPDHRVLIKSPEARALCGEDEVMMRAQDLVGDLGARVDHRAASVTYFHVMLEGHQVLIANSVAVDSFHPAYAALPEDEMDADAAACLDDLYERHPDLVGHPDLFGPAVRQMLGAAEAAILSAHLGPSRGIYGLS